MTVFNGRISLSHQKAIFKARSIYNEADLTVWTMSQTDSFISGMDRLQAI